MKSNYLANQRQIPVRIGRHSPKESTTTSGSASQEACLQSTRTTNNWHRQLFGTLLSSQGSDTSGLRPPGLRSACFRAFKLRLSFCLLQIAPFPGTHCIVGFPEASLSAFKLRWCSRPFANRPLPRDPQLASGASTGFEATVSAYKLGGRPATWPPRACSRATAQNRGVNCPAVSLRMG